MTRVERRLAEEGVGFRTYFRLPGVWAVMAVVLGAAVLVMAAAVEDVSIFIAAGSDAAAAAAFEATAAALADGAASASFVSLCVEDVTASD